MFHVAHQDGVVTARFFGPVAGAVPVNAKVQVGWLYDGETFSPPPPAPVPASISRVQFLLVADSIGYTEAAIEALISADETLTENERAGLLIRFRAASDFPRDWPHIALLAPELTPPQIDDLYRYGATL